MSVSDESRAPQAGTVLARRYELRELLGKGGMARVWRAFDRVGGGEVALKFIDDSQLDDEDLIKRFKREARVLERLADASPHVVRVFGHGLTDGGVPFLAMEVLSGETLSERLKSARRLPPMEVIRIVTELNDALQAAHDAGVVHRDVKPANVFLHRAAPGEDVTIKLLDFGIAKQRVDSELTAPTRAGTMLGTPQYMSPEQFLGDTNLDLRADLWSVGVLTYRMLVGHAPFSQGPSGELAARILGQQPEAPSKLVPGLTRELDEWMQRALAKRAPDRFPDARVMATALRRALTSTPLAAKEDRRAKGVNLIELVKLLRRARREGTLPPLSAEDEALLGERILVSSWYPIEHFWRLLALAYEHVLGRSDDAAIQLGRIGAERVMSRVHSVYVSGGHDLDRVRRSFERGWGAYFDFGALRVTVEEPVVRVTVLDYPDVPRVHGLTTLGWFAGALSLAGAPPQSMRITREPWSGDETLCYEFVLAAPGG